MMRGRIGVGAAVLVSGAVLLTGCSGGSKTVEFASPVGASGSASQPTASTSASATDGTTTDSASGVVIKRSGNQVCITGPRGGTACTSGHGTVVVDGVTVKDGVVVSGNAGAVKTVPPQPTKGQVRITGAVTWNGSVSGTCEGHATDARTVSADLPSIGTLQVRSVGGSVIEMKVVANGQPYGLRYVGGGGPVAVSTDGLTIEDAQLGSASKITVNGSFDC